MDLKKEFQKHGIDTFGVCDALPYNKSTGADYSCCIVALFPYFCGYPENSNLSIYTHGKDYHTVARNILNKVAQDLMLCDYEVFSDSGPCIERELCVNAGLGFLGKNGLCINKKYGSYFFIGYIVCKQKFPFSLPDTDECAGCMQCISECPGNALDNGFDESLCVSAITQKKGELDRAEIEAIKRTGCIFGCDICQRVCPHNRDVQYTSIDEFKNDKITRITLEDIATISNKEFKTKYGNRAFAWRGKRVLERNLKIVNTEETTQDEDSNT